MPTTTFDYKVRDRDGKLIKSQIDADNISLVANKLRAMELQAGQPARTGNKRGAAYTYNIKEMRDRGAFTIAQDEKSSVVWGMPGASVALGAVDRILPIDQIAEGLVRLGDTREERRAAGS